MCAPSYLHTHETTTEPIHPLQAKAERYNAVNVSADLKVKVEVTGSSEEGISPNTVDFAIKEGLTQYGIPAKVEPKKREH